LCIVKLLLKTLRQGKVDDEGQWTENVLDNFKRHFSTAPSVLEAMQKMINQHSDTFDLTSRHQLAMNMATTLRESWMELKQSNNIIACSQFFLEHDVRTIEAWVVAIEKWLMQRFLQAFAEESYAKIATHPFPYKKHYDPRDAERVVMIEIEHVLKTESRGKINLLFENFSVYRRYDEVIAVLNATWMLLHTHLKDGRVMAKDLQGSKHSALTQGELRTSFGGKKRKLRRGAGGSS
jgi:hypothetical protein